MVKPEPKYAVALFLRGQWQDGKGNLTRAEAYAMAEAWRKLCATGIPHTAVIRQLEAV